MAPSTRPETGDAPRKVGLFGGSFDPPHLGHLVAAREVADRLELDRVLMIPAAEPPHKTGPRAPRTPGGTRFAMVEAAVGEDPLLEASPLELERGGTSWTVDTVRSLRETWPTAHLYLIMGADQWRDFSRWRDPEIIAEHATLAVMTRQGEGVEEAAGQGGRAPEGPAGVPGALPAPVEIPVPRVDISSSDIRRRVREGRSIRYLVPDDVRRIIEAAKLYTDEP